MLKKTCVFLAIFLLINNANAETCPTLSELKAGTFRNWQPLDLDNAEPLSPEELNSFKKNVAQFAFAQWMPDAPEGSGHCFYYGTLPDVDYLGVYLVKYTFEPDKTVGNWYRASTDTMQCNVSVTNCRFKDK